jgi:hypothetical protein
MDQNVQKEKTSQFNTLGFMTVGNTSEKRM